MKIILVLNILSIILASIALFININILKKLNSKKVKEEPSKINLDDKLNSLEFNIHLDDLIRPLLGKFNNKDIEEKVSNQVIKYDLKVINKSDQNKIRDYISDVLLNYNNHIVFEEPIVTPNDIIEISDDKKTTKMNEFDLGSTINNFYRD